MLLDNEDNEIALLDKPNAHILSWGRSGEGKTYFACRKIEKEYQEGKSVMILDYSGSYTEQEMAKNYFMYSEKVQTFSPYMFPYYFVSSSDEKSLCNDLKDTLVKVLNINSYYQDSLLQEAITYELEKHHTWNIPEFLGTLTLMLKKEMDPDKKQNLCRLLTRLAPYESIKNFYVRGKLSCSVVRRKPIILIQLSNFPEMQRQFMTELLTTLMWKDITRSPGSRMADTIIFDEFQGMSLKVGSALSSILREGRKYGVSALLNTQFLSLKDRDELSTLTQVGNTLIFRPAENNMGFSAKYIDSGNSKAWRETLHNLKIGQAVLCGQYTVNGNKRNINDPVVVIVKNTTEEGEEKNG